MSMQSINLTLLGALHAAQDVHDLFRQLGYPVETPDAFIGDDLDALDLDPADRANVVRAYIVARLHMHTVYLYEVHDLRTTRLRSLAWNILQRGTGLLIVTTPAERGEYREILFVDPRFAGRPVKSAVRVNKLRVVTAEPTRHDLDTLNAIHAHRRTGQQVYDAQGAAFNVTTVTKRFYDEYRGHYERAKAAIQKANPGVRDFYDADKLHAFTQRLLGRLMFLYFLQRKGWLGGRTRFLTERYTALQRQHAGETHDGETYYYYRDVLEPLFFQTLNTKRPGDITRWEGIRIPYLNGGLFDEARDPAGPILIPDSLFDPNDVNGLLGFFNRYNFTIADDTPLEQDVAVDPEMLGKVFENLLEERDRGQSGSFYTPRSIVSYMCQEALAGYLEESAGIARETTRALFDPDADAHLTPDQAIRMNAALDTLTVLDPAVGSGSFLIGMMNEILRLRLACHDALTPKSPLPQQVGERGLGDHALRERGLGDHALRERGLGDHALRERGLGDHALRERGLEDHALEETGLEDREQWHITPQMRARMTAIARTLRKNATPSEDMLWQALRNRQLDDRKFKRQVDIGAFILDFYCAKERLAVEVDGAIHDSQQDADRERQSLIESLGIRFVRVKAEEVEQNLPAVLNKIRAAFLPSPHEGVGEGSGVRAELPSPREAVGEGSGVRAELPSPREGVGEGSGVRAELITAWKEAIIRDTLYGVDIKPEAIEIAQLRLWLALVVDQTLEQARPLPNLDYKLMAGDSLIETLDGEPVLTESAAALLSADVTPVQLGLMLFDTDRERGRLDELRRAYFSASPEKRKRLKPDILHQERRILTTALREKAEAQQQTINQIGRLAAQTRGKLKTSDERRLKAAAEKLARLTALQEALDKPDYAPPFFLYRLHFSEVFEKKGGFDIVVANPPYVRGERLGAAKDEFRVTPIYKDVYAGTADLYVYFYARGWHLLRPGGQLAYITSNKYLRANYGRGLRRFLAEKLTLRALIDFGDLPVFEAAAYPCIVIGEKALTPSPSPTGRGEKALTPDPSSIGEGLETQRTGRSSQGEGSEARNEGRYREMASRTLVQIARDLRQRETSAEQVLWECLRDRRLANLKFRRQHPVPQTTYVVDFFCYEHRLVVELDGEIHARQVEADRVRQQALEALGLRVLRFPNEMVFHDLTSVLAAILQTALASPLPEAKEPGTRLASPLPEAKEPGTRLASPLPEGEGLGVRAVSITRMDDLENLPAALANGVTLRQADLGEGEWQISDAATQRVFAKLKAAGVPLGEYVGGKIYYGIKTGLNEAFVIDAAKRAELIAADPKSAEIIKPWLRGRDIKRWRVEPAGLYVIFARQGIDIEAYPAIKAHLEQFRARLTPGVPGGRKPGTYQWYELQDTIAYYAEFEKPKIVFPDIAPLPQFAFDTMNAYLGNTAYIIPIDDHALLAYLNSPVTHYFYGNLSTQIRGGYFRFIYQYVSQLPIPTPPADLHERIAALARACLEAAALTPAPSPSAARGEGLRALEAELNALVYQAYGLDADDIRVIESAVGGESGVESSMNDDGRESDGEAD